MRNVKVLFDNFLCSTETNISAINPLLRCNSVAQSTV